jgi:hypothetical protein
MRDWPLHPTHVYKEACTTQVHVDLPRATRFPLRDRNALVHRELLTLGKVGYRDSYSQASKTGQEAVFGLETWSFSESSGKIVAFAQTRLPINI